MKRPTADLLVLSGFFAFSLSVFALGACANRNFTDVVQYRNPKFMGGDTLVYIKAQYTYARSNTLEGGEEKSDLILRVEMRELSKPGVTVLDSVLDEEITLLSASRTAIFWYNSRTFVLSKYDVASKAKTELRIATGNLYNLTDHLETYFNGNGAYDILAGTELKRFPAFAEFYQPNFISVAYGYALASRYDGQVALFAGDSLHALAKLDSGGYPMAEGAAQIGNLGTALILRGDGAAQFTPIKDGANPGSYVFLPPLMDRYRYSDFIPERGMAALEFVGKWQESNAPITIYENGVLKYTLRD